MLDTRKYTANINDYDNNSIHISELPENFVIKAIVDPTNEDYKLYLEFIRWLNKSYSNSSITNSIFGGDVNGAYYGIKDYKFNKGVQHRIYARDSSLINDNVKLIDVKTWVRLCKDKTIISYY